MQVKCRGKGKSDTYLRKMKNNGRKRKVGLSNERGNDSETEKDKLDQEEEKKIGYKKRKNKGNRMQKKCMLFSV